MYSIINHADGFREAALRCNEKRRMDESTISWLPIQGTVNAAFACELYLKALLMAEGYTYPVLRKLRHNLNNIFSQLSPEKQDEIANSIDLQKLEKISNTFEDWRFLYEDMNAKFHDENICVYRFMEVLYTISSSHYNPIE